MTGLGDLVPTSRLGEASSRGSRAALATVDPLLFFLFLGFFTFFDTFSLIFNPLSEPSSLAETLPLILPCSGDDEACRLFVSGRVSESPGSGERFLELAILMG